MVERVGQETETFFADCPAGISPDGKVRTVFLATSLKNGLFNPLATSVVQRETVGM